MNRGKVKLIYIFKMLYWSNYRVNATKHHQPINTVGDCT